MLAGCDNGCVETYRVSSQNNVLCETESQIQAHDDMVLGVALLACGEKTVTVGQDRKSVALQCAIWCVQVYTIKLPYHQASGERGANAPPPLPPK